MSWFVYLARCRDRSLYCGVATDLARRAAEHNSSVRGARYTRARRPIEMVWCQEFESRSEAQRAEVAIKRRRRAFKEALCAWR